MFPNTFCLQKQQPSAQLAWRPNYILSAQFSWRPIALFSRVKKRKARRKGNPTPPQSLFELDETV